MRGAGCLGYAANDTVIVDARRTHYFLPRYPVVSIAKLEMQSTSTDPWEDITTTIVQQQLDLGLIEFGCYVGDPLCLLRCTYTGGYWYETLEPLQTDGVTPTPGYPSTPAAGAALSRRRACAPPAAPSR